MPIVFSARLELMTSCASSLTRTSGDAAQLGDRIQMSLRYGIEDIHGIVGRVGNVNVATRRMHGCVIEASGCAVFRQSYISDLS